MSTHGLLGRALGHSFSPAIHAALWGCEDYALLPMEPPEARAFLQRRAFDWLNVTIPYKRLALEMCDEVEPHAARIGAVNTLLHKDGVLYGYNTDYLGMRESLRAAGIELAGRKVLVLGSGGTGHTACALAQDAGAAQVVTVSRAGPVRYADVPRHADAEVLINTTPVGMYPDVGAPPPVDIGLLPALRGVMDVIFNPLCTALVGAARERGIPAVGGLAMLVEQARAAAEVFSGHTVERRKAAACLAQLRLAQQNLVLIGMPGCGKTTVGRLLAQRLGRPFVDLDEVIVREAGCDIPTLFATQGEAAFRAREAAAALRFGAQHGLVIACGGGTPVDPANRQALAANGRIYWLDAPLERLSGEGRPLSSDAAAIYRLWQRRRDIYARFAHLRVPADTTPEREAEQIQEDLCR